MLLRHSELSKIRVKWPTLEEMEYSTGLFESDVFTVVHGGHLPCSDHEDDDLQTEFW